MPAAIFHIAREIEETYPLILRATVTDEQAQTLGYVDLEEMAEALDGVTVRLSTTGTLAASVDAEVRLGTSEHGSLEMLMTFALPTSITDTAHALPYVILFEPGSPTAERALCKGTLTISPRPTA